MTNFIPHTPEEREVMLKKVGADSVADLFNMIPKQLRESLNPLFLFKKGKNELELQKYLTFMASRNSGATLESFLGGGAYHRFIPPAVESIASRSEFYTAYTPYQPEISQGTLQMIYEFQTMMSELTGMDVTNASVYDGATALSEAVLMALRASRKRIVYASQTLNPQYQKVLETYLNALGGIGLCWFDPHQSLTAQIQDNLEEIAAVVLQQPDYFGNVHSLEEYRKLFQESSKRGTLFIVSVDPLSLALLESPRAFGAHIICGDIQQFGNSLNYGGPYGGFISTTEKLMRQIPGRLVGRTVDKEGRVAYTLTLQTREQHIRREKATSNICTNQSLNILKASVYLSLVGPQGLRQVAELSAERAHFMADELLKFPGVNMRFDGPFINEFALHLPIPANTFIAQMQQQHGILPGIAVSKYWPRETNTLLVAVTEMNGSEGIRKYINAFKATLGGHGFSIPHSTGSIRGSAMLTAEVAGRR